MNLIDFFIENLFYFHIKLLSKAYFISIFNCCLKFSVIKLGQKINYMFFRHPLRHCQPHIKIFYCIPTNKYEKWLTHRELSVQCGRHLPCLLVRMVGWLNSGAPTFASWHHLLKKLLRNIIALPHLFLKKVHEKHIIFFSLRIFSFISPLLKQKYAI